jgi:hypothetical protein
MKLSLCKRPLHESVADGLQTRPIDDRHEQTELCRTQALINHGIKDFSGAYMAVKYVAGHMDKYPDTIGADTVNTLTGLIRSPRFEKQKQSYFLFNEAAEALIRLAARVCGRVEADPMAGPEPDHQHIRHRLCCAEICHQRRQC